MVGGGLHQTPIGNALRDASTLQQRRQVWRGADGQGQPALVAACNYGRRRRRRGRRRRRVLSCQQAASGVHTVRALCQPPQGCRRPTDRQTLLGLWPYDGRGWRSWERQNVET
jgi:hypothetical protein